MPDSNRAGTTLVRARSTRCLGELLDAAHITPDSEDEGDPVVTNGVALCKLHHAAFDRFFFAIRPDYVIEVRPSILRETDGPMLIVGLQQIHGQRIHLPRRERDLPDRQRLERRFEDFRQAAGSENEPNSYQLGDSKTIGAK